MTETDKSPPQSPVEPVTDVCLTARQQDILALLFEGFDNQAIARRMVISIKTVENHLTRLYRQLNVEGRNAAVSCARENPQILGGRAPDQPCAINNCGAVNSSAINNGTMNNGARSKNGSPSSCNGKLTQGIITGSKLADTEIKKDMQH